MYLCRMKFFTKQLTVFGMLFVLLISTLGMSVNTLYCYCKGEIEYSLFEIEGDNHCDKNESIQQLPKCCQKVEKKQSCCKTIDHEKKPCTKKGSVYVKLNVDYLLPHFDLQKVPSILCDFIPTTQSIWFNNRINTLKSAVLTLSNPNKAPPIKPYGKNWCIFVQSFLC